VDRDGGVIRPEPFYNRRHELAALSRVWQHRPNGSLAIVYGRRRLGKTFLLQRFFTEPDSRDIKVVYSLANQTTSEIQRLELAERLLSVLPDPLASARELAVSWNSLFRYASQQATKLGSEAKVALVLDEFPYLVDKSPELPSVLQSWWDMEGAHSPI
jgi:AAA+ ATPase superfamily predicted ATPase